MNTITPDVRKKIYLNTVPPSDKQTLEENGSRTAAINQELSRLESEAFLNLNPPSLGDFVDVKYFNQLFEKTGLDTDSGEQALSLISTKLSAIKENIIHAYDNLHVATNQLASAVDAVSLYNNVVFSGIKSEVESFDKTDDLFAVDNNSLFVDIYEKKLFLNPSGVSPISPIGLGYNVNTVSNGYFNNSAISNAFDGLATTYLDYRQTNTVNALRLNFTVTLPSTQILNQIIITPNNFGTQNWLELEDIKVSTDGNIFASVFDNSIFYQTYLFNKSNEEVNLVLNPENNNMSDNFAFDFAPVQTRYIQFSILQKYLHPINNDLEIGIAEIQCNKINYSNSGSIIVKKPIDVISLENLSLKTDMLSKIDSELLKADFYVSFDLNKWYDIQSVDSNGSKPEVLHFNQPWLNDSIDLNGVSSDSVFIKIVFSKNTSDINRLIQNIMATTVTTVSEFKQFPSSLPYSINLSNAVDPSTVALFTVPYVALKKGSPNNSVLIGNTSNGVFNYSFKLPFNPGSLGTITVGSVQLTQHLDKDSLFSVPSPAYYVDNTNATVFVNIPSINKHAADFKEEWLTNNPTYAAGSDQVLDPFNLTANQPIVLTMAPERLSSTKRKIKLTYSSDGIKENFTVLKLKTDINGQVIINNVQDIIPAKTTKVQLSGTPIDTSGISIIGLYRVNFIDGFKEFIGKENCFSIDFTNGILYLRNAFPITDTTIAYTAPALYALSQNDFEISQESDGDYVTISNWIFDPADTYEISYNMAIKIDPSIYKLESDNRTITFTDSQIMNIFYGSQTFQNKNLKVKYGYKENLQQTVSELADSLTPILDRLFINYSTINIG